MPSRRREELLLVDIVERADVILEAVDGLDEAALAASQLHRDAVLWSLSIIGEAARRLPTDFCAAHPQVPWSRMVGFRNVVLHTYENIDASILWATVREVAEVRGAVFDILRAEYPLVAQALAQHASEDD